MKKLLFLVVALFWMLPERGEAQISIHPEVGVSYLRYVIPENVFYTYLLGEPRNIDPLFGISTHMPIHKDWYIKSRITFCKRVEKVYYESGFVPIFIKYNESNLNMDFSINYAFNEYLEIGSGPTIVRAFAEEKVNFNTLEDSSRTRYYNLDRFLFGLNAGISICYKRLRLNLAYLRIMRESGNHRYNLGKNRFDLTVSFHLLGGDKGKKR